MRTVSNRQLRKQTGSMGKFLAEDVTPAIQTLLNNDAVTQKKVVALEERATAHEAFRRMGLGSRLWWLLTGAA